MSIRSCFMARFYDATMNKMESACLSRWRSELLSPIGGDVLEIGSGAGANLPLKPLKGCERPARQLSYRRR